ncbi:MAG: galactose oxidase-like domain-containing protein [Nevskiaceae bacterium]
MRKPLGGNAAYLVVPVALLLGACSGPEPPDGGTKARALENSAAIAAPQCEPAACAAVGGFTPAFVEPLIDPEGAASPESPDLNPLSGSPGDDRCIYGPDQRPIKCKPTAGSVAVLNDGRVLYFNALEGTERVEYSIFFEAGHALQNDQTRVMTLDGGRASWILPQPNDAGAENPDPETLTDPGTLNNENSDLRNNDGALFCADLATVAGGRVLAVGGSDYYNEPGTDVPIPFGISELEGLKNARLYDPKRDTWTQTGSMAHGRWYPTALNLPSGDVLVASGVTKLVKPLYPEAPEQSGSNVRQIESWDLCSGQWAEHGPGAERSLPLYPRLHLLPDGQVLYNAAGQAFNPFGQSYDQATWNLVAAYDPATKTWADVAYAGMPAIGTTDPLQVANLAQGAGFRGSTFSIMLPLMPDADGHYTQAEFLTAGGVTGNLLLASPGSNQPTAQSRIDTISIGGGAPLVPGVLGGTTTLGYASRTTGPMNAARWYGTGVLLPTGEVMVFSGADRDEVQVPGTGMAILTTERFDPATEAWALMAHQGRPRTYHNTAALLPDGRVLVGGHAPINTAYAWSVTLPGFSPNDGRDPSFEIYSPPYVFAPRPAITESDPKTLRPGDEFTLTTHQADTVTAVVLVRRTDLTHLVDADQRAVVLPIVARSAGKELRVRMPGQAAVVPPGEYLLFIVAPGANGPAPSVSLPVTVPAGRNC